MTRLSLPQYDINTAPDDQINALLATHIFRVPSQPASLLPHYNIEQILNAASKLDHQAQLRFIAAYRASLGAQNQSRIIDTHKMLFGLSPKRLAIALLQATKVVDPQGRVVVVWEV